MALVICAVLLAGFWAAQRLLGFWPALLCFLFIALDPFHIAHSRLLHLDGGGRSGLPHKVACSLSDSL
jgi:hypothetical protein